MTENNDSPIQNSEFNIQNSPVGIASSPGAPRNDIMVEDWQAKAEEYLSGWQRAQADYANLQKQMSTYGQDLLKQAKMNLVKEILPTLTYLETALEHAPEDMKSHPWLDGIKHIAAEIEAAFARLGLTRIKTVGEKFNPLYHEAAGTEPADQNFAPDMIVKELSAGYLMGEQVIQPARVVVARATT